MWIRNGRVALIVLIPIAMSVVVCVFWFRYRSAREAVDEGAGALGLRSAMSSLQPEDRPESQAVTISTDLRRRVVPAETIAVDSLAADARTADVLSSPSGHSPKDLRAKFRSAFIGAWSTLHEADEDTPIPEVPVEVSELAARALILESARVEAEIEVARAEYFDGLVDVQGLAVHLSQDLNPSEFRDWVRAGNRPGLRFAEHDHLRILSSTRGFTYVIIPKGRDEILDDSAETLRGAEENRVAVLRRILRDLR